MSAIWPLRLSAIVAPLLVSAGFVGLAHFPPLRVLLYLGAVLLVTTTLLVGIGLVRAGTAPS
jgi:hypothetical protein